MKYRLNYGPDSTRPKTWGVRNPGNGIGKKAKSGNGIELLLTGREFDTNVFISFEDTEKQNDWRVFFKTIGTRFDTYSFTKVLSSLRQFLPVKVF